MICEINVGINRRIYFGTRTRNRRPAIEHKNVVFCFFGRRWFSRNMTVAVLKAIAVEYPGWALTGYAPKREIR